jgi:hypothetical protein
VLVVVGGGSIGAEERGWDRFFGFFLKEFRHGKKSQENCQEEEGQEVVRHSSLRYKGGSAGLPIRLFFRLPDLR